MNSMIRVMLISIPCIFLAAGCTSTPQPSAGAAGSPQGGFMDRAESQTREDVTVTAAVPSAEESKAIFGSPLYRRGVQPVWLKIENHGDKRISFLPVGLDPQYFSPIEAAHIESAAGKAAPPGREIERLFFSQGMHGFVEPGESRSGFVFSALDEGTKSFNVDVVNEDKFVGFTFFIPVPGLRVDHHEVDWENLYGEEEIRHLTESEFIGLIENQVCCTTDKKSEGSGDPVNLVVVGDHREVYYAFIRAGWDETETINKSSSWKTVKSFIGGGEYRYSPISGLYVLGRPQDVAFQKARDNIHERNHLRLWMTPWFFEGKHVWLGQISRDIGVRFTAKTITTHKIDPDVDETREFLLEDLAYSQSLKKIAYLEGVGAAPITAPRANLTGDPYFTDGYRLVLWLTDQPVDIADIEVEYWRIPPDRQ
jgi:hypothetical protein